VHLDKLAQPQWGRAGGQDSECPWALSLPAGMGSVLLVCFTRWAWGGLSSWRGVTVRAENAKWLLKPHQGLGSKCCWWEKAVHPEHALLGFSAASSLSPNGAMGFGLWTA